MKTLASDSQLPCSCTRVKQRPNPTGPREQTRASSCQSTQQTEARWYLTHLAHRALWTEAEGGGLKSPGMFLPVGDSERVRTGSLSDPRLSKPPTLPPSLSHECRLLCCEGEWLWQLIHPSRHAVLPGTFHCSEAVTADGTPLCPTQG